MKHVDWKRPDEKARGRYPRPTWTTRKREPRPRRPHEEAESARALPEPERVRQAVRRQTHSGAVAEWRQRATPEETDARERTLNLITSGPRAIKGSTDQRYRKHNIMKYTSCRCVYKTTFTPRRESTPFRHSVTL